MSPKYFHWLSWITPFLHQLHLVIHHPLSPQSHCWHQFLHVHDRDEKHVEHVRAIRPSANSWPERHFYGNSLCFTHILNFFCADISKVASMLVLILSFFACLVHDHRSFPLFPLRLCPNFERAAAIWYCTTLILDFFGDHSVWKGGTPSTDKIRKKY